MLLFLLLISLFPILIWAYIFSYIDGDRLNKYRFIMGVLAGIIGVFPIVFFAEIFTFLKLSFLVQVFSNFNLLGYLAFIFAFIFLIFVSSIFYLFIQRIPFKKAALFMLSSFGVFIFFSGIFSSFIYLLDYYGLFTNFPAGNQELVFSGVALNSFKLIIFYYLFIALIEELSKHIYFLSYSVNYIFSVQKAVLYSIFVTLGFVFVENILYLYNIYTISGFSGDFFQVYLSRFIFSLMVHVLCSSLFAYYFAKAYLKFKGFFNFEFLKLLLTGIFCAVTLHAFFDVSLSYGWSFILIIYFLFAYFYVTGIFYRN